MQSPSTQASEPVQVVVHPPQWAGSMRVSTQTPLQSMRPDGQAHEPAWQVWSARQSFPHSPQCSGSVASVTHEPKQSVWPAGQSTPHVPSVHASPAGQS